MFKTKKEHKAIKEKMDKYKKNEKLLSQNAKSEFEKAIDANKELQKQLKII